jgi:uncharacterized membrane protein (DUF485 family)
MSLPGNATVEHDVAVDYQKVQSSTDFRTLKSRHRRFVFPVTVAALLWYCGYVLLAAFAESFMATRVLGNVTMGIVLGLLQIVTTFVVAIAYVRYANRVLDTGVARLRASVEGADVPAQAGAR